MISGSRKPLSPKTSVKVLPALLPLINVEATDEVPAPFYIGTLETKDGDIDCKKAT